MTVKAIGSNRTEISLSNGDTVLFSYSTCVAACVNGTYYKTSQHWSKTTSKHITQWLDGVTAKELPQAFFNSLA